MSEQALAAKIAEYWRERGCTPEVTIRTLTERTRDGMWRYQAVRSDMRGGLPRSYQGELAKKDPAEGCGASQSRSAVG